MKVLSHKLLESLPQPGSAEPSGRAADILPEEFEPMEKVGESRVAVDEFRVEAGEFRFDSSLRPRPTSACLGLGRSDWHARPANIRQLFHCNRRRLARTRTMVRRPAVRHHPPVVVPKNCSAGRVLAACRNASTSPVSLRPEFQELPQQAVQVHVGRPARQSRKEQPSETRTFETDGHQSSSARRT